MDIIVENLKRKFGDKYAYLKLFDVIYDKSAGECIVTFLYPMTMREVDEESRKEVEGFVKDFLSLNAKTIVKYKKSFNDPRILRKDIKRFIDENFKAVSVYLTEEQIEIDYDEDKILVRLLIGKSIQGFYESNKISSKVYQFLNEKNIGNFSVESVVSDQYEIKEAIPEVEMVVEAKRKVRYSVEYIKKIVGGNIVPEPELIKHQSVPKQAVILAGNVSNLNEKEYVAKSGRSQGQTKKLYTFVLNDGKKIECVYFCSKSNEKNIEGLQNDMFVLCVGDLKIGFNGKLNYYPKSIAYAAEKEKLVEVQEQEEKATIDTHKQVIFGQKYNYSMQEDLFAKETKYSDFIMQNTLVIYDLETTGLDSQTAEIIEIGAVKIEKGKVTEYFSTFVKPSGHIPEEVTKVNNITDDMVKDGASITDAIIDFYRFCSGCVIGGYNNEEFDNKFVKVASKKIGFNFDNESIDVMKIVRQRKLNPRNFKLTTICSLLGISLVDAHRAYNDAFATAKVLLKLNEIQ